MRCITAKKTTESLHMYVHWSEDSHGMKRVCSWRQRVTQADDVILKKLLVGHARLISGQCSILAPARRACNFKNMLTLLAGSFYTCHAEPNGRLLLRDTSTTKFYPNDIHLVIDQSQTRLKYVHWYLDISWSHVYLCILNVIMTICSCSSELNIVRAFATKPLPRDDLLASSLLCFFHVNWLSTWTPKIFSIAHFTNYTASISKATWTSMFFSFCEYHQSVLIFNESIFTLSQPADIIRSADILVIMKVSLAIKNFERNLPEPETTIQVVVVSSWTSNVIQEIQRNLAKTISCVYADLGGM